MSRPSEVIVAKLASQIEAGSLAEGQRLPSERDLAESFCVSRMPVREALLTLQSKGLIVIRNRARAEVSRQNASSALFPLASVARSMLSKPDGISDLVEARILFECGLARSAARHATPKQLDRLAAALGENRKAIGHVDSFIATDAAFHAALADIPQNAIFAALSASLAEWLIEQRRISLRARGAERRAYKQHVAIYETIAAHSPEAADKAMMDHLTLGARIIERHRD